MSMVDFNRAPVVGSEIKYIEKLINSKNKLCGDGYYGNLCQEWFEKRLLKSKALMTPSCTSSLELAALLIDIKEGDEVILPSFTFVSTANAFVLRGAKLKFVDIDPKTQNIDSKLIEASITLKTKAIVPVHYAGVSCEMDEINEIAKENKIFVIEDAAQGVMSKYKGQSLGGLGHMGAFSFHETKNYTSAGEGGLLCVNDSTFMERAEIIREKGTNRSQFFRGVVDKYSWVDIGSSYLPSDVQCAYLWAQLEVADQINERRLHIWNTYHSTFESLEGKITRPFIPKECEHNAHMYYILCKDLEQRTSLIEFLKANQIQSAFHYVPLHSSKAGRKFGEFVGQDQFTSDHSERLLRLPLFYNLSDLDVNKVIDCVMQFYK
jgi:dTDP-4-amino-4,6-dideoxygalactose transaminase